MIDRTRAYAVPAAAALLAAWVLAAQAQEGRPRIAVTHAGEAEGRGARTVDLRRFEDHHRKTADLARHAIAGLGRRVEEVKASGHRAGLPGCAARKERSVRLAEPVPAKFRNAMLYFVRARAAGIRPAIMPAALPEGATVFVLEAAALGDVALLAKTLRTRVTLSSAEFARAMGVECADARVTFSADGTTAFVQEERP